MKFPIPREPTSLPPVIVYGTPGCPDWLRVESFLTDRGVLFEEIDIEDDADGEDLLMRVNQGKRKVRTWKLGARYFACSPFRAEAHG